MKNKGIYNKVTKVGYILCFIACIIFYIYVGNISQSENQLNNYTTNIIQGELNEKFLEWKVVEDSSWNENNVDGYKTIMNDLPEEYIPGASICFRSYQEIFEVFVDGKSIYKFELNNEKKISRTPGGMWNIIRLPQDYNGKKITIKVYDPYNEYKGSMNNIFIGSKLSHLCMIFNKYIVNLVISIMILILAIIIILLYCYSKEVRKNNNNLIYLAIFLVVISLWSLTESTLLQVLGMSSFLSLCQAFMMAALIPLSFIMYIKSEFDYRHKYFTNTLVCIYVISFISMLTLQLTGIIDLKETIVISHIFMIITILETCRIVFEEFKEKLKNKKVTVFAVLLCLCAGLMDLIRYYFNDFTDVSFFTRWVLMINVIFIIINCIKSALQTYFTKVKEDTYKQLAYMDNMTGLNNRNLFQKRIMELNENLNKCSELGIVIFDVNNLKMINDKYGHLKGDELISNSGKVIKRIFEKSGEIFRIGGDEFCVIVEKLNKIDDCIKEFERFLNSQKDVETYNKILISYGYEKFDYEFNKDLYDLFERADKKMYDNKCKTKMNINNMNEVISL